MRRQRSPTADPRSTLTRRACSLHDNGLGPDGARALAPALEKMVGLKKLKCATNAARQPIPAQTSPASSDPPAAGSSPKGPSRASTTTAVRRSKPLFQGDAGWSRSSLWL